MFIHCESLHAQSIVRKSVRFEWGVGGPRKQRGFISRLKCVENNEQWIYGAARNLKILYAVYLKR